jgi:hypothetical protein
MRRIDRRNVARPGTGRAAGGPAKPPARAVSDVPVSMALAGTPEKEDPIVVAPI